MFKCFIAPQGGEALLTKREKFQNRAKQISADGRNDKLRCESNLVTGSERQKLKHAFLLSAKSSSAARKQQTALIWQDGSVPLSVINPW